MAPAEHLLDSVLVLRCRVGDDGAFEVLVKRYHGRLLYFIRRLLQNDEQAEDLVQEVWLAAYRQLPRLRQAELFRTWLYRIARNKALTFVRDRPPPAVPLERIDLAEEGEEAFGVEDAARIHTGLTRLRLEHL
jgi:RNA polymerase sigma-70 factor, ECF subfamily